MTLPVSEPASTIELLDSERRALLALVASVPESLREERPGPDRWSVAELLEHLVTVERSVVRLLETRLQDPSVVAGDPDAVGRAHLDAAGIARLRNRGMRLAAPDRVKPRGVLRAPDALRALEESRTSLEAAFLAADATRLDGVTHAHPVLGTLTLHGWVQFVAHHEARHAEQLGEIARSLLPTASPRPRGQPPPQR